jgi:hypothetical protein
VSNGSGIVVDLPVVAALEGLVAKEVNVLEIDPRDVLLLLDVLQAIGLIPASGENIEGDLAANRVTVVFLACSQV